MITFRILPGRPSGWDAIISGYSTKTLFHESAWLDHVQSIHPTGRIVYYEITDDENRLGFYCALRITRMMIPIQGSPLGGTGTNYMGPIVDGDTNQKGLIRALTNLFGPRHFLHLELSNPWLDREVMKDAGFHVEEGVTHVCELGGDLERAWAALKPECRNRVRKAEKNGVVVERTNDPAIVDHFFDQFGEVYGKQGMLRPFSKERPRSLFNHLNPAGRLLPLWAVREGEVLAAGLFPFDERCAYFWGAASWIQYQKLCPNEALHWAVIKFAVENGIPQYNMCGGTSQFKDKFGGSDIPYLQFHKSALPLLQTGRRLHRAWHFRGLRRNTSPAVLE